jgi:predicted S18 family serine protease
MGYVDSPRSIPELPEGDMTRQDKRMTSEELVHDVGSFGLWLFAAILLVLAAAAVLESIATR